MPRRDERDRAGQRARPGACRGPSFGIGAGAAELRVDRAAVGADDARRRRRAVWSRCRPGRRRVAPPALASGMPPQRAAARRRRRRARARRRGCSRRPRPRSRRAPCPASRPCRGRSRRGRSRRRSPATTPAAATLRIVSNIASFAGSVSAPPPEKLMTSMPSATACSNAATISGVLRDVADRRRHVEHAVVADPRARRDAREARRSPGGRRRRARSCRRRRRRSRRRACRGTRCGSTREPPGLVGDRRREDARDDHLRRRPLACRPSGSPGG